MSLYTPVFPAMPAPKRAASQSSLSSSLAGSSQQPQVSISSRLRDQHLALASVPAILSPPSPAPEPNSGAIEELIQEIHSAVEAANWHPSSGKWAHVHSLAKLSCSEGCYWSGLGRRVPSRTDDGFELFLADTEEEYAEWETRQEARRQEAKRRSEEAAEREMEQQLAQGLNPKTQAAAVAKVMQWQADFVPESQPVGAESQNTKQRTLAVSPPPALPANQLSPVAGPSKGKEKEKAPIANSRFFPPPAPLQHPEPESTALAPKLPAPAPAQDTLQAMSISPEEIAAPRPAPTSEGPRISQVSESYIPPSFEGVVTSTPQPEKVTLKLRPPAIPIVPGLLFPSIVEPEPFAPSQAAHPDPVPGPSSPPVKRPYTAASPIEDSFELDVYASAKPTKKVRTPPPLAPEPIARPSIVPVSSPPRTSIPPLSQCSSASTPPGLGNIHDLPPVTPDRRGVLATSQRSQPLPRPLSRRQSVAEGLEDDTDKRPARTYFSSPASRSSNGSPAAAPTSPVSPLFTQDKARPGSQHPDLGYNSQVDVEARIENISAILENDVDFDQWLRQSANPENPS